MLYVPGPDRYTACFTPIEAWVNQISSYSKHIAFQGCVPCSSFSPMSRRTCRRFVCRPAANLGCRPPAIKPVCKCVTAKRGDSDRAMYTKPLQTTRQGMSRTDANLTNLRTGTDQKRYGGLYASTADSHNNEHLIGNRSKVRAPSRCGYWLVGLRLLCYSLSLAYVYSVL